MRFPNESSEYRAARDALLDKERALVEQVKAVAAERRKLPPGGQIPEDYRFIWATDERLGQPVRLSELFGDKTTLLLYSFMYGPSWDHPCPSCTSIVDGLDRMALQVGHDAAIAVIGKAAPDKVNAWAGRRGWSQIALVSGIDSSFQADYHCQTEDDERQHPSMQVFRKVDGNIHHFWGTEMSSNDMDMFWPYWNLFDLTPDGRPDRMSPPQDFRSRYLEDNYFS